MSWTKRQIVLEALGELAMQAYDFDVSPEEVATAVRRLDVMMATWETKGARVGYRFPATAEGSDPDAESGIPDSAVETVVANLAIRLAPGFGKTVSAETKRTAGQGYDALLWSAAQPIEQQMPSTLPRGAGNRGSLAPQRPFFPQPDRGPLGSTPGGDLDILTE